MFRAAGLRAGVGVLLLAAVGALAFSASALAGARPLIQGGTVAKEGQFPWMAWVKYGGSGNGYEKACSGTVVAPNVILTAGHCMSEGGKTFEAGKYTVVTGSIDRNSPSAVRSTVSKVIPHPSFYYGGGALEGHDAGLLVLSKPITAPPIALATSPSDSNLLVFEETLYEAGWGLTGPHETEIPEDLYWTTTLVQEVGGTSCEYSVCTGSSSAKGTCAGDSGGPLWGTGRLGEPVEVGLTSRGPSGACNSTTSTRVDEIEPWIEEQVAANTKASCTTNSGTVKLSPGLSNTAAVQTLKIKGTLSGCTGEAFTELSYKATLTSAGPLSCAALTGTGEAATGSATYKWMPKAKPATATGPLSFALSESPSVGFSGEVATGSFSPLSFAGVTTASYEGGSKCGVAEGKKAAKPIKKGAFSGTVVDFDE